MNKNSGNIGAKIDFFERRSVFRRNTFYNKNPCPPERTKYQNISLRDTPDDDDTDPGSTQSQEGAIGYSLGKAEEDFTLRKRHEVPQKTLYENYLRKASDFNTSSNENNIRSSDIIYEDCFQSEHDDIPIKLPKDTTPYTKTR